MGDPNLLSVSNFICRCVETLESVVRACVFYYHM